MPDLFMFTASQPHHIKFWKDIPEDSTPPNIPALCEAAPIPGVGHVYERGLPHLGRIANAIDWSTVCKFCLAEADQRWDRTAYHLGAADD